MQGRHGLDAQKEQGSFNRKKRLLRWAAIMAAWIAIWQAVYLGVGQDVLFASPGQVVARLTQLVLLRDFWMTVGASLGRILAGLSLGIAAGVALAILTSSSSLISDFFKPLIGMIQSTPVTSFIVLAMLWISRGRVPVFISFLSVLPVIWANVSEGIRRRDRRLLEMASVFRMKRITRLRLVDTPQVLPYFMAAFNSALGLAWKAGITAEVIGNPRFSIGGQIYSAKIYLETVDLFVWTAVLIMISALLEKAFRRLVRKVADLMHIRGETGS
jgi:NitT/TauT family transport system permease protein